MRVPQWPAVYKVRHGSGSWVEFDPREIDMYGQVLHYRISGYGDKRDGLYPGGAHGDLACDMPECRSYTNSKITAYNRALQSVRSDLKTICVALGMGASTARVGKCLTQAILTWSEFRAGEQTA